MNNPLVQFGNIPVTTSSIESLFPHIIDGAQKIRLLERDKHIIRLKRGLYICSPEITGERLSTELIANHLYAPSYISMSSALYYYGLIPERAYTVQSMTLKCYRKFDTPLGRFEYKHISKEAFSVGLTCIQRDGYAFVMATPEKALCDLIASSPYVNIRYYKDAVDYLKKFIRMDIYDFRVMRREIFEEYIEVGGKKCDSIKKLLTLLRR